MADVRRGSRLSVVSRWATAVAVVGALFFSGCTPAPGDGPGRDLSRAEKRAVRMLTGALTHLAWVPVIRYQGRVGATSSGDADLRVSRRGAVSGFLREGGERIRVLAVAGRTFIKASAGFYAGAAGQGENQKRKAKYLAKRWVKVDPEPLGDPAANLRPHVVAQRLLDDFDKSGVSKVERVDVEGAQATRMSVGGSTLYVSDATHRLVKVEPSRTLVGAGHDAKRGLSLRPAVGGASGAVLADVVDEDDPAGFGVDDMGLGDVADFYNDVRDQVRKLRDAVDSDIKFRITAKPRFVCSSATFICRASIRVKNKVTHGKNVKGVSGTVQATLQGIIFGGVLGVRTCADTATMRPNGRATMICIAAFPKPPPRRQPQTFPIRGQWFVVAHAVIAYKKIIKKLKRDRDEDEDTVRCSGEGKRKRVNAGYFPSALGVTPAGHGSVDAANGRSADTPRPDPLAPGHLDGRPFWVGALDGPSDADDLRTGEMLRTSAGTWVQIDAAHQFAREHQSSRSHVVGVVHRHHAPAELTPVFASSCSGPVEIRVPAWATSEEAKTFAAYVDAANKALANGQLSPTGRVSTAGAIERDRNRQAARERRRAIAAGTPYKGVAGHAPDAMWLGHGTPPTWIDMTRRVNSSLSSQGQRYDVGYKPTKFVLVP